MTQQDMGQQQNITQQRAAAAWACIEAVEGTNDAGLQKKYGSLVRGLSAMIHTNGLGQTLAFLKAKGGEHHNTLLQHLSDWVSQGHDLLQKIMAQGTSSTAYRHLTTETLAYLLWLKRFAEAKDWCEEGDDNAR